MKKGFISFLFIFFLTSYIFAQDVSTGGILYGENWACLVTAPKGWIMDQSSFAQYGIYGLFYEETKKLGGNTPIIYINTTKLSDATDKAMNNYISYDINSYIQRGAEVQEAKLTGIKEKELKTYQIISGNNNEFSISSKIFMSESVNKYLKVASIEGSINSYNIFALNKCESELL